jgi:hypothetical protein
MPESEKKLVFLGVGDVARAIALQAGGQFKFFGTTRSAERAEEIRSIGLELIVINGFSELMSEEVSTNLESIIEGAYVVVSFPPDEESDAVASRLTSGAKGIVYISSTTVYGSKEGVINEDTEVDETFHSTAQNRLKAERRWLEVGASVIRAPGIYGRGNGLIPRLISGTYALPGDGNNFVSRIHVDDLSAMILSALLLNQKQQVFLSGDALPTTHREIVEWLASRLNLPFPESIPLDRCHYTQRGNRKVDASRSLEKLGTVLQYPTYKEGYGRELESMMFTQ